MHCRLCLDDPVATELLAGGRRFVGQGDVPADIKSSMSMSQHTALRKPKGKVRGIAAGDTFRR